MHRWYCCIDRDEITKENEFQLNDDDEDDDDEQAWDGEAEWNNDNDEIEGDVKDESAAYLEFLHDEARRLLQVL